MAVTERHSTQGLSQSGPKLHIPSAMSPSKPDQFPLARTLVLSQEGHQGPFLKPQQLPALSVVPPPPALHLGQWFHLLLSCLSRKS